MHDCVFKMLCCDISHVLYFTSEIIKYSSSTQVKWISSALSVDFPELTSDFQTLTCITFLLLNNILVIKLSSLCSQQL